MNGSRGMMSFLRRHCACKDVFQSSNPNNQVPKNLQLSANLIGNRRNIGA
jgi:hypothetical protein